MIRRIEEGEWNPEEDPADKQNKDALAALGYHEAFQYVKSGIRDILSGAQASEVVRSSFDERSEEHTSELQSLMRISYAVFCLKKKKQQKRINTYDKRWNKY